MVKECSSGETDLKTEIKNNEMESVSFKNKIVDSFRGSYCSIASWKHEQSSPSYL